MPTIDQVLRYVRESPELVDMASITNREYRLQCRLRGPSDTDDGSLSVSNADFVGGGLRWNHT